MWATALLLLIIGFWILINTFNGNLPGLATGKSTFNNPFTTTKKS